VDSFARWCRQCEANLDGLRIAEAAGIEIGRAAMEDDPEAAGVVALLLAESRCDQPAASEEAISLLRQDSPDIRHSAWWGLRLADPRQVEAHLRPLLDAPGWSFPSAAALDILAFHRLPVGVEPGEPPDEQEEEIAWLLAEAGGRIPGAWDATRLTRSLGHSSARVREAALHAAARCGLSELRVLCREATVRSAPLEAVEFLGVVGSAEDLARLERSAGSPSTAAAALAGLGRLGLPAAVPALLEFLDNPELADCAAAAIERIVGQAVPRGPEPEPPPDLGEEELDLWEPHPPVDTQRARGWWKENASRFDPARRYQAGLDVTDDPLGPVFEQLPLTVGYDIYLRERALTPGTPDWELETWAWRQKDPRAIVRP